MYILQDVRSQSQQLRMRNTRNREITEKNTSGGKLKVTPSRKNLPFLDTVNKTYHQSECSIMLNQYTAYERQENAN